MVYYIKIDNKYVPLIFGLKSLIQLSYLIDNNEEISVEDVLKLGTRVGTNELLISSILNNFQPYDLKKSELSTLLSHLDFPSSERISELYKKSVGEMGISPTDFFNMTEDEVENAYIGYLRRQELTANLTLLALKKAVANDDNPIKITEEKNYEIGSVKEHDQTFRNFNV